MVSNFDKAAGITYDFLESSIVFQLAEFNLKL